jgi:hypothetical protein
MLSIRNIAHQLFPRESGYFMDAYKQSCSKPFGYLLGELNYFPDINLFSEPPRKFQQYFPFED